QAEDGIRDYKVTGVQTCALPIYAEEVGRVRVLSLEEAVRRMTSDPADFFGMRDRGRLKAGQAADVVIFDPATVGSGGRPERLYRSGERRGGKERRTRW